ncbi:hypothetical protein GQ42DRAFT_165292 [Ramicandelaber brevisporus]|nr:hypothetical protein GQ42DRAFT_165292 [Ramicandelaber brevisporus]
MKVLIVLVLALFALFSVASAGKAEDYQAYKSAEASADRKKSQCGKYAKGDCATIAECDTCVTCLTEVISLYQTAVRMRRDYTKKWFNGQSDAGHAQWEKNLTSGNNDRTRAMNVCRSKKKTIQKNEEKKQKEKGTARSRSPTTSRRRY